MSEKKFETPKTEPPAEKPETAADAIAENKPEEEAVLDLLIQSAILKSTTINQGNNGLIKKIRISELPPDLLDYLAEKCGLDRSSPDFAFKMIKLYVPGKGRQEFAMQKKAFEIIEEVPESDRENYARIPEPYLFKELPINNDDFRQMLNVDGLNPRQQKIEIILMDLVDGEDLATKVYKSVIRNHTDCVYLQERDIETMRIEDLQDEVGRVLGFKLPGGKSKNPIERAQEAEKVFNENVAMMISFLANKGVKFDPRIFSKIKNTVDLLHRHQLYHRDLHERNVMVGSNGEIHLIDFGEAIITDEKEKNEIYHTGEKRLVHDDTIEHRFKPVLGTVEASDSVTTSEAQKEYEKIKGELTENNLDELSTAVAAALNFKYPEDAFWESKFKVIEFFVRDLDDKEKQKSIIDAFCRKYKDNIFFKMMTRLWSSIK
jgi:hypothetical protein